MAPLLASFFIQFGDVDGPIDAGSFVEIVTSCYGKEQRIDVRSLLLSEVLHPLRGGMQIRDSTDDPAVNLDYPCGSYSRIISAESHRDYTHILPDAAIAIMSFLCERA